MLDASLRGTLSFMRDTRALILTIIGTGRAVVTILVTDLSMQTSARRTKANLTVILEQRGLGHVLGP